jgi:hypothetical protein
MFQRAKPAPAASNMFEAYPAEVRDEPRAPSRELREKERNGTLAGRSLPRNSKHIKYDVTHVDTGSPRAAISYEKDADVKVSFKVLADQRGGGGNTAANRAHGRASAIAAQERELRFTKEQGVLDTIVRNQVSLESKYTKEVRICQESANTCIYARSKYENTSNVPFDTDIRALLIQNYLLYCTKVPSQRRGLPCLYVMSPVPICNELVCCELNVGASAQAERATKLQRINPTGPVAKAAARHGGLFTNPAKPF